MGRTTFGRDALPGMVFFFDPMAQSYPIGDTVSNARSLPPGANSLLSRIPIFISSRPFPPKDWGRRRRQIQWRKSVPGPSVGCRYGLSPDRLKMGTEFRSRW